MNISSITHSLGGIRTLIGNIIFPPYCMICHTPTNAGQSMCPSCITSMHMLSEPLCRQCSHPFEYAMFGQDRCEICLHHPPAFDAARAVWRYDDKSAELVKKLKFSDKTHYADIIGKIMCIHGSALLEKATIIAPVPLHSARLRQRRYNQSMLLATAIQSSRPVRLIADLLVRTRNTVPQTSLDFYSRSQNVMDAFSVHARYLPSLAGERILLIDDVITTGATLNACAETLKAHGAAWVGVLTIAKRLMDEEKSLSSESIY